ncbi:Hypothetical protein PHPALM_3302 [Phytophthora palmivora]|uniref:Uncharacterized protein n=1 Tax=Phytophthora palmivora TaxID=4796 RepID=A0A2P4YMT2_9STRA|nr:Hypothetical protein PHPALM_3302 [Phytophthora palmivora]
MVEAVVVAGKVVVVVEEEELRPGQLHHGAMLIAGNNGPVRRQNHYSIMKDYWGDAAGMNNRPHLSTEDPDTIAATGDAASDDVAASATPASPPPPQSPTPRTMSGSTGSSNK